MSVQRLYLGQRSSHRPDAAGLVAVGEDEGCLHEVGVALDPVAGGAREAAVGGGRVGVVVVEVVVVVVVGPVGLGFVVAVSASCLEKEGKIKGTVKAFCIN